MFIIEVFNFFIGLLVKIINSIILRSSKPLIIDNKIKCETNNLKILSYNIDCLFVHYDVFKLIRLLNYIETVISKGEVDIICLQEVWEKSFVNKLIKLAYEHNWSLCHPSLHKKYFIGENTGLVFLSKYEIEEQSIYTYSECKSSCAMAYKSAQFVKFKANEKDTYIVNTHLQSSFKYLNFTDIAQRQLDTILGVID